MKKQLQLIGIIALVILLLGVLFKSMHWPGAGILILSGVVYGVVYTIVYLSKGLKTLGEGLPKTAGVIGAITIAIVMLGFLFKLMHWPGAGILVIVSHVALFITAVLFIIDAYQESDEKLKNYKALLGFIVFVLITIMLFIGIATGALKIS